MIIGFTKLLGRSHKFNQETMNKGIISFLTNLFYLEKIDIVWAT